MIIKSKDFVLRDIKKSDLVDYWKSRNDKDVGKNMVHSSYPYLLKTARKDFSEALKINNKGNKIFSIDINGKLVGIMGFYNIIPKYRAKIGYWIGKDFRGKGIMTKAVKLGVNYIFKKYGVRRIYGNVRTFNKASARVLEKCGFKLEGILRKNVFKNGKYFDDFRYARVR